MTWACQLITSFGQVQRGGQVAQLGHRQGNAVQPVGGGVELFQRHHLLEGIDGDVVFAVRRGVIDEGDDGGVKGVFDGKHCVRLGRGMPLGKGAGLAFVRATAILPCMSNLDPFKLICRAVLLAASASLLAACEPVVGLPAATPVAALPEAGPRTDARTAVDNFVTVAKRLEPVAERTCRAETRNVNCDFQIVVDDQVDLPPNAFQTLDAQGRPIIGFTIALIADARNQDELALILGHEAAHHILGHIPQQQQTAMAGALLAGVLAAATGFGDAGVQDAQNIGASLGARQFAKSFELQADELGTKIAQQSGFDPVNGAAYFGRIPDPGNRFLGTHPPNGDRVALIRRTAAGG